MQKKALFIACFFIWTAAAAQQYPFVHYTPKDGLVSNRVRSIYQDSKGRLYFNTLNGLSVYDGARFTNYTTEDGLHNDIVNCVMEMGDDSIWVVTNTSYINCLVKGKLKPLVLSDSTTPVINFLCRNAAGNLYAAADDGLFLFDKNAFVKLPFKDMQGQDINSYIISLVPYGNYLLVMRDYSLLTDAPKVLYLYDCIRKKIVSQTSGTTEVISVAGSKDGLVWMSTGKGIRQLNTVALSSGKFVEEQLPSVYRSLTNNPGYVFFDNYNNCWLTDGSSSLKKCDTNGNITVYTTASGLNTTAIGHVFQDKEGIIWLASNGGGVEKLMHTNLSLIEKPPGFRLSGTMIYRDTGGELLLYSPQDKKIARFTDSKIAEIFRVNSKEEFNLLAATSENLFAIGSKKIFRLNIGKTSAHTELLFNDTTENRFGSTTVDKNGSLIISGSHYLTAIRNNSVFQIPIGYMADQVAVDRQGMIWAATRREELIQFSADPEHPSAYLKLEALFKTELKAIAPRSITADKSGKIWIGTRYMGLFVFKPEKEKLNLLFHLTAKKGLTENFISWLTCDEDNNIWACSPSGLDKIHFENKEPVIENLTRQNNMYQYIYSIIIDKNKTAWAMGSGGLIKITPGNSLSSGYTPRLMITQIRAGTNVLNDSSGTTLSYKQNNLSFYFAALSFLDEKQILFSYQLQGSGNSEWSDPTNNASASFIDLRPGNYILNIKAKFPAGRYPEQIAQYKFSILPPWWQTWWFRTGIGILGIGILVAGIRFYYLRKLEKQKAVLEKKQAVEKERTRIATDMHDDLGAGLSRIKFLSETIGIKKQQGQPIEEDITKIREYSHEMIDKMGEIVWALNEKNDSLSDLLSYTRSYAVDYISQNGINCKINIPENIPDLFVSGEFRRNIYLTIKEALHNIIKHARANNVSIDIATSQQLSISIKDDGVGFDTKNIRPFSNGISNMQKRMTEIKGIFNISGENGTAISLTAPLY